jgi:hypothetical protein
MVASRGSSRWAVTLALVLLVTLAALVGIAGLRLAQMRSTPMAVARGVPAAGSAGLPQLEVSADAWSDPLGQSVADALGNYFDAINNHDYAAWVATVTPAFAASNPEAQWEKRYQTSRVGNIRLSRIDQAEPGRLLAMVTFVSTQSVAEAPAGAKSGRVCWGLTFPVVGTPPKIDNPGIGNVMLAGC